jgi:large subunit ribosomal protein L3
MKVRPMVTGLVGKKVGMTQLFAADGTVQPATVLRAGPCVVSQVKTVDRDGYEAVQLGFVDARPSKENKAIQGHFKKAGVPPTRIRREVRIKAGGDPLKTGDQVNVSIFTDGDRVDVIGTSRGKGFQGVVKRHHFSGGRATHGSMFHRAPGSIGASSYPSRVVKGMRMAGHMGAGQVTVRNLKVLRIDAENNLLIVEGAVPGGPNSVVVIRKAIAAKPIRVAQVEPTKKKGKK